MRHILTALFAVASLLFIPFDATAAPKKRRLVSKECVECHQPVQKELSRKVVHAPFRDAKNCEACHKRHGVVGTLVLIQEQPALCFSCHKNEESSFKAAHVHQPAIDGKCTGCHAAHASDTKGLLRGSGNEPCFRCHDAKKFTEGNVHKAAAGSCLGCHNAHGSAEPALLVKSEGELCTSCHRDGGNARAPLHGGQSVTGACTSCHDPHRGSSPELLREVVHAPLSDCSSCHRPTAAGAKPELTRSEPELCFDCHTDKQQDIGKENAHAAFTMGSCTTCHSPHATTEKALLKDKQKKVCLSCHENIGQQLSGNSHHQPAFEGSCSSCHDPHVGKTNKLLKAEGEELCGTCHQQLKKWQAAKNVHAAVSDCTTCHVPHGSGHTRLAAKPSPELCLQCHEDQKSVFERPFVHAAVRDGGCSSCHDPHASDNPKLLGSPEQLCARCHEDLIKSKAEHAHTPFSGSECSTCHTPHASERSRLLKDVTANLCRSCHEEAVEVKGKSVHAPVRGGSCESCHDAHGSRHPAYLISNTRQLCFSCHSDFEARLRKSADQVHAPVKEGKCDACHSGHASPESSLLKKPLQALCTDCHQSGSEKILTAHAGFAIEKTNCISCHDPHLSRRKGLFNAVGHTPFVDGDCGACHARATAPPAAAKLAGEGFEVCVNCHSDFEDKYRKGTWTHAPAAAGQCVSCHNPHAARAKHLVAEPGARGCTGCHPAIAKDLERSHVHGPVKSGECTSCHSPHTSDQKFGLVKKSEELCFGCHEKEKALAKASSVHAPFASGSCDSCHATHATDRPNLLLKDTGTLCRGCHDLSTPEFSQAHRRFPAARLECTSCHNPHGSEQPKLVRSRPHQIFRNCGKCHDTMGARPEALQAKTTELCARCHSAVKVAASKPGAHKAMSQECTSCHNPHAADEKGLIKEDDERALCLSCHREVKERVESSRSFHPVKANGGRCTTCHAAHQSEHKPLLRTASANLCETCHKGHAQFGHPTGAGVIDPRTGKEMNCLSCHDPHGTQQKAMLVDNPQRALCVQCHPSDGSMPLKTAGGASP